MAELANGGRTHLFSFWPSELPMSATDILRLYMRCRAPTLLNATRRNIMSTRSARQVHSAAAREKHASVPGAVRSTVRVETAANDDKPTEGFSFYGDPLFGMAIASVVLLAVLAALVAMS
jgi:hypothetical protein